MSNSITSASGELHLTAEQIAEQIIAYSPIPSESIPRAVWLFELSTELKKIITATDSEYKISIEKILDEQLTDDTYEIVQMIKEERFVNLNYLKEQLPTLYNQCAFVDSDLVVKHIGKSRLRELMIDKLGEEEVYKIDSVNIDSIEAIIGKEEAQVYIITKTVPNGYKLIKKEEAK